MRLFAIDTHAPRAQSDMAKYPRNSPDRDRLWPLLWIHNYIHTYPHSQLKHSHFPTLEGEIFTPLPLRDLSRNSPKLVRNFPKLNLTLPFMDLKHTRMYIPLHLWILTYILCYVSGCVIYVITSISLSADC